ncbi:siderophore-interacting protein [Microbacterium keratanolyticum]|uniref:Siderophore-interacting protein n=2 Tax=Microbacterium keratanolyticum TaxID=67574 RepID=A0A9W6HVW1_9MICO|nr:siderophore-interacting protein [Microbacterium keratanolyticum]
MWRRDAVTGMQADAALWARAAQADDAAFAEIFDRHGDRVYRHARRLVAQQADAEDVTAMVFLEAWRSRTRVRVVDGSPLAWLLVTATNLSRNLERGRIRHERALRQLRIEDAPDHAEHVAEEQGVTSRRAPVQSSFGQLSRRDQEILMLCVIEELPPREVAVLMRVPAGTVRTRLSRAKKRLREALEAGHPDVVSQWRGVQG